MEETKPKTGKYSWTYGLLMGAITIIFGLMLYSLDMHYQQNLTIQLVGLAITIAALFLAIQQFKTANGGYITLSEALKIGVGAATIAALIAVIYQYALANFIDPDFTEKAVRASINEAASKGNMSQEQIQQGVEMGKKFFWIQYPVIIVLTILIGLVISLIIGLIVKKQKPEF